MPEQELIKASGEGNLNKIRIIFKRFYFYYFHFDKIKESRTRRGGECKRCGECCRNLFNSGIRCPLLKGNLCRVHRWKRFLPVVRQLCYFDTDVGYRTARKDYASCGYWWEEKAD